MNQFQNPQNNWAYVFLLLVITTIAAVGILNYTRDTINEINSLSSRSALIEK
ncbi:MAG: hypothetical protein ABIB55_02445 [Candidatus Nealsonbacteria bacterium]